MKSRHILKYTLSLVCLLISIIFAASQPLELQTREWTIAANTERAALIISYEPLGVVLDQVQLMIKQDGRWEKLSGWQVKIEDNQLLIHTGGPSTDWTFFVRNRVLGITSTVKKGMITALAPADENRFPVRMIDYSGRAEPVAWKGTAEVEYSFGGNQTKNLSFLPADNHEVLYLSLGQVTSRNMHSLFDKMTDTMISFHKDTGMLREIADTLKISVPIGSGTSQGNSLEMITIYADYYTDHLGLPVYKPMDHDVFKRPPVLWNSWTNYYYLVTEKDVINIVDWIADNFNDYGLEYVVIDDGPEMGDRNEHYWISNWNKETFPHGPEWLTGYIHSKGLKAGLWVVPNAYAGAVDKHPEWYLHYEDGSLVRDYNTPALDCTNPEVLDFLTGMFTTLKNWGFEYYKFDGEFALTEYIPDVNKSKLHNPYIPPLDAYYNRLKVIRKVVGESTFIEGCPAGTPLQGIGYFNSYFNGDDIYNSWHGMYPFFISLNGNIFLNHITTYLMPGEGICVSPIMDIEKARTVYNPEFIRVASSREANITSVGTTINEAKTIVTFAALCGTPFSFADRLPDLPEERINLLKKSLPTLPVVPMDLFSRGGYSSWNLFNEFTPESYKHNFPRIIDLKINKAAGIYDVVALINWSDDPENRNVSFENKLGLDPEKSYLVFDFWNQEFLGVYKDSVSLMVEPHETRVLHIRPVLGRPQLLGTDRHISGSYSIEELKWDSDSRTLSGMSRTVKGSTYTLFVYVPDGFSFSNISSNGKILTMNVQSGIVRIVVAGQKTPFNWSMIFK